MNKNTILLLLVACLYLIGCQPKTESEQQDQQVEEPSTEDTEEASPSLSTTNIDETSEEDEDKVDVASINYFKEELKVTEIDTEFEQCLEEHYSTAEMILCTGAAFRAWDNALNTFYKKALKSSGAKEKDALKKAQKSWVNYKIAEEKFIDDILNDFDGSLHRVTAIADKLFVTEIRTLELIGKSFGFKETNEELSNFVEKKMNDYFGQDDFYSACEAKDGSNLGMRQCAYKAAEHHDKKLNEYYKKLSELLNKEGKALFKKTQLAWIKYRDNEVAIYDAIYHDMGGGSMYPTLQAQRKASVVRQRALELESHYEAYKANK